MTMTIRELADQLGVRKSKVEYRLRKLPAEWVSMVDGIKHLNDSAVEAIKQDLSENTHLNTHDLSAEKMVLNNQRIIELEAENRLLREQIAALYGLIERIKTKDEERSDSGTIIQGHLADPYVPRKRLRDFLTRFRTGANKP